MRNVCRCEGVTDLEAGPRVSGKFRFLLWFEFRVRVRVRVRFRFWVHA